MTFQRSLLRLTFFAIPMTLLLSCHKQAATSQNGSASASKSKAQETNPAWLQQKIAQFQQENPANPPVKIYRYQYQNQPVYYISSRCCDIPSEVYTVQGQQLCQPDGGFTGKGDGKCADFFQTRTDEKLVWEDLRK